MSYHSQPSSQKTRHYANLASKLQKLQNELRVTEGYMEQMSKQLDGMSKFGAYSGAQWVLSLRKARESTLTSRSLDSWQPLDW